LVWLWFRSPHCELAAGMMRTSEPPHELVVRWNNLTRGAVRQFEVLQCKSGTQILKRHWNHVFVWPCFPWFSEDGVQTEHGLRKGTGRRVFALLNGIDADRIGEPECLRRHPVQAQCGRRIFNRLPWREVEMTAATKVLSHRLRPFVAAVCLGAASAFLSAP